MGADLLHQKCFHSLLNGTLNIGKNSSLQGNKDYACMCTMGRNRKCNQKYFALRPALDIQPNLLRQAKKSHH